MGAYLKQNKILEFVLVMGIAIVFLAVLMVLLGSNAQAADIYVDDDNIGGPWDGSMANPYQNITSAIANSNPTDTIYVWDGSYNENITINKSLQLIGNGSATTIIDGFGTMNNIINITAKGVEITGFNFSESGLWYGIWANVGGFYIHDNVFDTQNWAIYMDINRLNSGSTTVGDIIVDNNEVIGTYGFYFNIWFDEPLTGSDLIFGNTVITKNTLHNTQTGIAIDRFTVFNMDQGSVTWGDIQIQDNFVNCFNSNGIFFWGIFWNITDVNIDLGKMDFFGNNVTAQSNGIYIDWWDFADGIYGNTTATVQDTHIHHNTIVSQSGSGITLQTDIMGNKIYDSASVTTGDFFIYSNNITTTIASSFEGIYIIMSEIAQEMYNDSSVNFGNIYIDSNIVDSNNHGIYFNYQNSFGTDTYDNALVTMGDVHVTNNEISSVNHGIHIPLNNLGSIMYDQASATLGNFIINDNNLSCGGNGINIDMDQIGYEMHDSAFLTMGYFTMDSNNITSANQGINIQGKNIAKNMHNDTMFSMGDFTVNNNTVNSTGSMGINFVISSSAYTMTQNATATFGNFLFTNNNITALNSHGLWFAWYNIGFDMHDGAVVTAKDFHLDDNTIECGPNGWGIYSDFIDIGNNMHGDSLFSLGDWNAEGNIILSGYLGIYAGPQFWGNDMYDNSIFIYGDFFIRNNEINVTGGGGIMIDYIDTGENMAGTSSVTGGNMSITNNIVLSRDNYGFYIYYDFIGYNITDFSYVSTGWIDISYNNFSSVNNHGAYIWIYYLGAYMYGNSQVYISDFMFTHNNVWSDTMDALHFYQFYQNAYQMHNDSYVQIGNILVNDNYLNASGAGDGIELFQWQQNAYEMSHNASADFGNFEFNRNIIEAGANGIYANNIQYWAYYLYWDNHVTIGHWQFNDNKINATGETGVSINNWYDIGAYMYGTSTFTVGNLEVLRNVINAVGGVGMDVSIRDLAYYNYGSSQCYFGDFLFNNNIVNASGDGIYISAIQDSASYMYDNSNAHFGNFEVNNNDIIAGYGSALGYDGIYMYFYDNGYKMYDNSEAYFGHLQINNNTITCYDDDGIFVEYFYELGAFMYNNSYFEIDNLEVCGNWIDANSYGISIRELAFLAYEIYDNSTAVFGDFLFDANTVYAGADGIYINAHNWGETMTGTTSATFGDFSVSNNIIESQNQGIYFQFERAGSDMHDQARFEMGGIRVMNNTIISGQDPASSDSNGILFRIWDIGYEMNNETQAIVGPILVNDNTVTVLFGTNVQGIYIDWISDFGARMYDMATFTMNGNIEVCRNTVNTTNGDDGIFCDIYNMGNYLYGDNTASYGDFLFNDNIIIDAYNDGMYILVNAIGYYTYGNSSVTIGNVELNNNDIQIVDGSYYSSVYLELYDLGASMYGGSIFNMGHVQMNDNIIDNPDGMGLYIEAYRLGYEMYNSSSAYFGNFEFLHNNITSYDEGINLWYPQYFAAYMYNNTSAFFGDFLINNNIINTTSSGADGIYIEQFQYLGYQMNDQSYAEFSNFEISGNEILVAPLAYGIYIWPDSWAYNMYDNATFVMGDWLINNNTVFSSEYEGIYFYSDGFGYNMYGNSSAHIGKNEIMYNTVNSTGGDGIESWWWNDFGGNMFDYSYFEVGSCYIMFNNITSTSPLHYGLETGPQYTGYYVSDEAEAYFGDYIISNNIIYSNGTEGIDLWYYYIGYWLDNSNLPESRAVVEIGRVMVTDNVITVPNGKGIYVDGYDVAYTVNDYCLVTTGGIHFSRNTINSFGHGIDIYMYELSENNGNNAQVWLGSFVIDDNIITATNGNGIYIYSEFFAYSTYDNAFVSMDDIFITNNDIVAGITGIELTCYAWIDLYSNSEARAPGLWITGNNVSAPVSAFNYTTIGTPTRIDPGNTFSTGNVSIEDNLFDGGLFGVMIDWQDMLPSGEGQSDFYFENNSIENGSANSIGLFMNNIQNATIESLNVDSYDQGIYVRNSNIWYMFNSTISNIPSYDLNLTSNSFIGAVNTTFDNASVYFEDNNCLLNVGWFMNVYVQSQVFLPVPDANLTVKDVDGTDIFNGTTNLNGRAFYIICWEYQENKTGIIKNFNDYTADANKAGSFGSAVPNPTMNQTRLVVIILTDLIPPTIFSDNSDTAGTTGEPFYFEINATDNMGIVSVHVNYRLGGVGPYTNLTMSGTGPYWLNEILPSDYVGFIEYYFTAVDSGGFWVNTTPTTAPIIDNDPPTIISDNSDILATTGETFNFIVDATDNINMSEVHVVWWFGAGAPTNDTMIGTGPYTFSIPVPPDSLDQLHYYFTMNDTEGNWLVGPLVDINVTDNDAPPYTWVSQPSAGTTGESVLVSLLATDNIDITYYKIDIDGTLYDLIKDGNYYNFTINIPTDNLAGITYSIIFNDSANNPNSTAPTVITVTDNDQPTFSWVSQFTLGTTGESVLVSILATDNIGITYYKIDIDGTLYDLIKDGNYYNYTINIPLDSATTITYSIILNDSANNPNIITPTMITVTDNDQPTYSWVLQPISGTTGESVPVSILATDNIGITYYKIEIDGMLYDLIKDGDYYNYTINIPPDSIANFTYRLIINDSANNPNIIPDTVIVVTDNDAPTYNWVSKPSAGVVGSSVLVSLTAYDNIGITNYTIYIDGVPFDMVKDGDYYNYTIDIPSGIPVDIIYNVTLRDTAGNLVATGDTIIGVISVDDEVPEYNWILHPATGTTGESVLVSLLATDNIGITYYKIEIDGVLYDLLKEGDYYNYSINIPSDSVTGVTYRVIFNDTTDNPVTTGDTTITVTDNDNPTYSWVLQPSTGSAGGSVLVSLLASDNIGVTYYKIDVDGISYDLIKDGDYYNYTINIPNDSLTGITYKVIFKDTADNSNTTVDATVTITDNDVPTDLVDASDTTATTGDMFTFEFDASDNIGLSKVEIFYWFGAGSETSQVVTGSGPFTYTITIPSDSLDDLHYYVKIEDTAGNSMTGSTIDITVTDNDTPYDIIDNSDTTATTGDDFTFNVNASDNIEIGGVEIYYWFGDGDETLLGSIGTGPFETTISLPLDSTEILHYYFVLIDAADNELLGPQVDVTITDNDPGTISNDQTDTTAEEGEDFTFQIDASDNIGVSQVRVAYWFGDDETQKQFITLTVENGTYSGSFTPDESGTLNYYFEVTDSAGNIHEGSQQSVQIASEPKEEEEEPTLLPWILVIIIILVVLIFFFLIMKKGKDGEEISEVEEGLGAEVELEGEVLEEPEDIEVDSEEEPEVEGEIEEVKEPEVESEEPTVEEAGPEETSTDEEPMDEIDRIIEGEIEKGEE